MKPPNNFFSINRVKICTSCGSLLSPRVIIPKKRKKERPTDHDGGGDGKVVSRFREHHAACVVCDRFDCVKERTRPFN